MELNTKVLIVDDNKEVANILKNKLQEDKSFEVVGVVQTAEEAISAVKNSYPDIMITDVVLKGTDGYELLEEVASINSNIKTVVVSALSQEGFVQKAIQMGASYYMVKPYNCDLLLKRIKEIENHNFFTPATSPVEEKKRNREVEEKITNIFITVGIPAHIKGYQFLREAIKMSIECPEIINSITKKLYPSIAAKFETSSSKVERAIRHAIEVAWNRGKIENINTLFGVKVYSNNEKPTNGEFIALVADKMLLEGI